MFCTVSRLLSPEALICALAILVLLWLVVYPLALLLLGSFRTALPMQPGSFTLANYAALIVNDLGYRIRELGTIRILWGQRTDGVAMDHPSTAKPENRTQLRTEDSHLLVCGRRHVWPAKRPASEKRAVLEQQYAVINDRVV